jgi:hypothetical protein
MQSHNEERRKTPLWKNNQINIVEYLRGACKLADRYDITQYLVVIRNSKMGVNNILYTYNIYYFIWIVMNAAVTSGIESEETIASLSAFTKLYTVALVNR